MVYIFDQTNRGSSCYLLTEHPNAMKITHSLQNKFYFVAVHERRLKFIQAKTVNDRIWKHFKNQARRLLSKICVQFDARKKN